MKFSTAGFEFDTEEGMSKTITDYAHSKGFGTYMCAVGTKGEFKTYVLFNVLTGEVIFESQSAEAVGAHIDILYLRREFRRELYK